jgi:hypothetical protein
MKISVHTLQSLGIQPVWLQDSAIVALLESHSKPERHLYWNIRLKWPKCTLLPSTSFFATKRKGAEDSLTDVSEVNYNQPTPMHLMLL